MWTWPTVRRGMREQEFDARSHLTNSFRTAAAGLGERRDNSGWDMCATAADRC